MSLHSWKDGEYGYCKELIETKGNKSVPELLVEEYLEIQRQDAIAAHRSDVVGAFDELLQIWRRKSA